MIGNMFPYFLPHTKCDQLVWRQKKKFSSIDQSSVWQHRWVGLHNPHVPKQQLAVIDSGHMAFEGSKRAAAAVVLYSAYEKKTAAD